MKKGGRESHTATMACMGRAAAHGRTPVASFSDPTALALLPEESRQRVERFRAGAVPEGPRRRLERAFLDGLSRMMVPRTVAIDAAVRSAGHSQVAILGAGLDGRAWRMSELRDAIVFEVDHPDSQREKRARASALTPLSRDVRFVPVDLQRDRLDDALAAAGHDPARATTWVWEGVVMYLTRAEAEATLATIERRSATGSRLIIAYESPSLLLRLVGLFVRPLGEPHRSAFEPDDLSRLLARAGFKVNRDEDLPAIAAALGAEVGRASRYLRIATADR